MVVYFYPDTRKEDSWSILTTQGAESGSIDVVIGELKGSCTFEETSRREAAVAAARYFAETGEADPNPTWFTSPEVYDRRPLPS